MICTIRVTEADILSNQHSCTNCPHALAINRVLGPNYEAHVYGNTWRVYHRNTYNATTPRLELPDEVALWIDSYDLPGGVRRSSHQPITYPLEIPDEYLRHELLGAAVEPVAQ